MLSKLIKYEFKATGRVLMPVGLGVLALSCLTALLGCAYRSMSALRGMAVYSIISGLVEFFTMFGLFAVVIGCAFICVQRFYRLLGEQGYLMLTLPVKASTHIAAKLTCAIASTLLCFVFAAFCGMLISAGVDGELIEISISGDFIKVLPVVLLIIATALVGMAGGFLFTYLCIAIGGHWPQQRLIASIIAYFGLSFAGQVLGMAALVLAVLGLGNTANDSIQRMVDWMLTATGHDMMPILCGVMAVILLICTVIDVILWAVTQYLMTKKLNLP